MKKIIGVTLIASTMFLFTSSVFAKDSMIDILSNLTNKTQEEIKELQSNMKNGEIAQQEGVYEEFKEQRTKQKLEKLENMKEKISEEDYENLKERIQEKSENCDNEPLRMRLKERR